MRDDVRHAGRWEARIGIPGSKHIYLGLFNQEKEAAQAYDRALVRLRGMAAATNFALSDYRPDLAEYHKMQQVHPPLHLHICCTDTLCLDFSYGQIRFDSACKILCARKQHCIPCAIPTQKSQSVPADSSDES